MHTEPVSQSQSPPQSGLRHKVQYAWHDGVRPAAEAISRAHWYRDASAALIYVKRQPVPARKSPPLALRAASTGGQPSIVCGVDPTSSACFTDKRKPNQPPMMCVAQRTARRGAHRRFEWLLVDSEQHHTAGCKSTAAHDRDSRIPHLPFPGRTAQLRNCFMD